MSVRAVSHAFACQTTGEGTSLWVPAPAGMAAGDTVIIFHADAADMDGLGVPDGWTLVDSDTSDNFHMRVFTRTATSGDVTAGGWTFTTGNSSCVMVVFVAALTGSGTVLAQTKAYGTSTAGWVSTAYTAGTIPLLFGATGQGGGALGTAAMASLSSSWTGADVDSGVYEHGRLVYGDAIGVPETTGACSMATSTSNWHAFAAVLFVPPAPSYIDTAAEVAVVAPEVAVVADTTDVPGVWHGFHYEGTDGADPLQVQPRRDWNSRHVVNDGAITRRMLAEDVGGGLTWRGPWSSGSAYVVDDAVGYGGSSYVCTADCTDVPPPNIACWQTLAQRGATWWSGEGVPSLVVGSSPGDYYLDEDSGLVYVLE